MASVFKAYEASLDRYVALKVLPPEFLHDPTFAERFRREAQTIARLEHLFDHATDAILIFNSDGLLVDGNPLADIGIMADRNRFAMIMKDGAIYKDPRAYARDVRIAAE